MGLIKLLFKDAPPARGMRRKANDAVRLCMLELGYFWKAHLLKKHFTAAGGVEYKFAKRTDGYNFRKLAKHKHRQPLVYSGKTKALAFGPSAITATATSTRTQVRVPINAPRLNSRPYATSPDMRAEVTAVSDADVRALENALQQAINRSFTYTLEK